MKALQNTHPLRAAVVQMTSTTDWESNLTRAQLYVEQAIDAGAGLITLPENFAFLGP